MILVIQNGYCGSFVHKYLKEDINVIKSFAMNINDMDNLEKYNMVIILGGPQSVTKISSNPNLQLVVKLIHKCCYQNIPLLGICLGAQLIAHAFGCEIKSLDSTKCGYHSIMQFENIFRYHMDYIIPNDRIKVISYFESMPYVFKVEGHKIMGIQCHPDIPPECIPKFSVGTDVEEFAKTNEKSINSNNQEFVDFIISEIINSQ
jgi:GMP synthase-like glutamine amidotransferase